MAVNETIVTGRKFRKLIDEATKLWQRISFWTKASDVEFDDGSNAETKFGAINGVTDSLTSTSSNIAASAAAVKALNDKVTELSSNIMDLTITVPVGVRLDCSCSRCRWGKVSFNFNADEVIVNKGSLDQLNCPAKYTAGTEITFCSNGEDKYGVWFGGTITFKKIRFS